MTARLLQVFAVSCMLTPAIASCEDAYVVEAQQECTGSRSLLACAKYRFSKYVATFPAMSGRFSGAVSLVAVNATVDRTDDATCPRQFPGETEMGKFLKFVGRQVRGFLRRQGVMVDLPEGARYVDGEDTKASGRKKKKGGIIFPLLVFIKLFKLEFLLGKVAWGIFFIKKALLIGGFFLFKSLKSIKKACLTQNHHHYYYSSHKPEPSYTYEEHHGDDEDEHGWDRNGQYYYYNKFRAEEE